MDAARKCFLRESGSRCNDLEEADPVTVRVPDKLDEALSPTWLSAALQLRFPGIEVRHVTPGPVVDRISTNARFTVEYAGAPADSPPSSLCVKGYFNEIGWAARHVGEPEASFYRDLVGSVGVRTLRSVYADVDPESHHGVVITEDVVATAAYSSTVEAFTLRTTASSLRQLAQLHASTWMQPRWSATPWLEPRLNRALQVWGEPETVSKFGTNLHGPNGRGVPVELRDPQRLVDVYRTMVAALAGAESRSPWCVIHGDTHLGNLFLDEAAQPCLLDWHWSHAACGTSTSDITSRRRSRSKTVANPNASCCSSTSRVWPNSASNRRRGMRLGGTSAAASFMGFTYGVSPRRSRPASSRSCLAGWPPPQPTTTR